MTPEQKKRRIAEIEQDVKQIMAQLHHIEFKVEQNLVERDDIMNIFFPKPRNTREIFANKPSVKVPNVFKKLWVGFIQEMKKAP